MGSDSGRLSNFFFRVFFERCNWYFILRSWSDRRNQYKNQFNLIQPRPRFRNTILIRLIRTLKSAHTLCFCILRNVTAHSNVIWILGKRWTNMHNSIAVHQAHTRTSRIRINRTETVVRDSSSFDAVLIPSRWNIPFPIRNVFSQNPHLLVFTLHFSGCVVNLHQMHRIYVAADLKNEVNRCLEL